MLPGTRRLRHSHDRREGAPQVERREIVRAQQRPELGLDLSLNGGNLCGETSTTSLPGVCQLGSDERDQPTVRDVEVQTTSGMIDIVEVAPGGIAPGQRRAALRRRVFLVAGLSSHLLEIQYRPTRRLRSCWWVHRPHHRARASSSPASAAASGSTAGSSSTPGGHDRRPHAPCAAAMRRMAARLRSTSSSVVAQELTLMRMAV